VFVALVIDPNAALRTEKLKAVLASFLNVR
jgi:hypothetical protein